MPNVLRAFSENEVEKTVQSQDTVLVHSLQQESCGHWLLCIPSMWVPPAKDKKGTSQGASQMCQCAMPQGILRES